ncbi:MFS transporter [Mesorhizobium sp. INR15]|uniref:MFS transporter n=1 Tax=Mesorhizobium sp. INR15 TaxID=2654248 RepID=UPI00189684B3|nr:MFS transporter [Mesorhizobium sp. INR15]QPC92975.1 MFS transporter [Mesorhizobium sp. INR15]
MLRELRPFIALLLGTFLMMVGTGLGNMLIPLRASAEGWSSTAIAWIGTSYALAFTAGCLLTPLFVKRVGHIRVFSVLQTLLAASLLLHALVPNPLAWAVFRAVGGLTLAGGYMVIESWMNERVSNANRGAVFAAYMIVSMSGVAVGQFILPLGSVMSETLFMVGALAFGLALIPIALSVAPAPQPLTQVRINARLLFRKSPVAVVGSFLAGVIFGNWSYFGPLYGQSVGLSSTGIATMLTAAMIGGMVFQVPFGKLSDRIDRRYVMAMAGAIGVAVSASMAVLAPSSPFEIIFGMFALGSVLFTIYALNVAHANDHAEPAEFVQVSGGLLIVYGIGNMVGPQLGGRLMDHMGPSGFFAAMGAAYALYGIYALWRSIRSKTMHPSLKSDFRVVPALPSPTPEAITMDVRSKEEGVAEAMQLP